MSSHPYVAALIASLTLLPAMPAFAAGEVLITHAKANAGNVTPGDTAGYPVTISIPGKFQLASNLYVAVNKIGIQVTGKNVTIDLNGFTLEGSDVAWYGVVGSLNAVTIENGTITQFKFDGINGSAGKYWIVDNVRSIENGRDGVVLGTHALVKSSVVAGNIARGIYADSYAVIQGNTVSSNGSSGVEARGSTVVGNAISFNGAYGLEGFGFTGYSGNTLTYNHQAGSGSGPSEAINNLLQHPNTCHPGPCN
jgi:hypothetical protein